MTIRTCRGQKALRIRPLALCLSAALAAGAHAVPQPTPATSPMRPASILPVTTCADDGSSGSLRSVVAAASSGDTIDLTGLACATITLLTGEVDVHVDDLTINGPGRETLTIDGNNNGRVFRHYGAGTLTISALTIANGVANSDTETNPLRNTYGGCILSDHGDESGVSPYGSVAVIDSTITHCRVIVGSQAVPGRARGGGIAAAGMATIQGSTISDCHIYNNSFFAGFGPNGGGGGAVHAIYLMTVTDSIISDNSATITVNGQMRGGGIASYGDLTMSNSVVTRNFAGCDTSSVICKFALGGGIDVLGVANISSSTISDNIAEASQGVAGGGIEARSDVYLTDTGVTGNATQGTGTIQQGGGLTLNGYAATKLLRTTVSGNSSALGGGIYVGGNQTLSVSDSTISGNAASDSGGGIFLNGFYLGTPYSAYPLELTNSTVTANVSTGSRGGAGIVDLHVPMFGASDFESSIVAGNSNAISPATYDADLATSSPNVIGAHNLIVAASGVELPPDTLQTDPLLGPLLDNGGQTQTHALLEGSPAIDSGSNVSNLEFDQRGEGFPRVSGSGADIGAFELHQANAAPTVAKIFVPDTITAGSSSVLTITLTNSNGSAATLLTDFSDTLPANVIVADSADVETTCVGGVSALPGSGTVTLDAGSEIPAAGSCVVEVSVTANSEGDYTNVIAAGALETDLGINPDAATAELIVGAAPPIPPSVAKSFTSNTITTGAASTLTITLGNANATGATLSAPLTDSLPSPVVIASPANATTTCPGGVLMADSGASEVTLAASATIPAGGTCTIAVSVTAGLAGIYTNTIPANALATNLGANADPAIAVLTVTEGTPPDRIFADGFDGASP